MWLKFRLLLSLSHSPWLLQGLVVARGDQALCLLKTPAVPFIVLTFIIVAALEDTPHTSTRS